MADQIPDLEAAIEQLAEFFGFDAHYDFTVKGERYRITYRQFLPADVDLRLREVDKAVEGYDRAEVSLPNGKTVKGAMPAIPLRLKGELVKDSIDAQRLIAMWGEEKYRTFEAAGGPPDMLAIVWAKQDFQYREWQKSKSAPSN